MYQPKAGLRCLTVIIHGRRINFMTFSTFQCKCTKFASEQFSLHVQARHFRVAMPSQTIDASIWPQFGPSH